MVVSSRSHIFDRANDKLKQRLVVGNWKMNGLGASLAEVDKFATLASNCDFRVLLCVPATLLQRASARAAGTPLLIGAQDCHTEETGAFTGEISAAMLADAGASHVILGHSERRIGRAETSDLVLAKVSSALQKGLVAIVCVGETEADRDDGHALSIVQTQIEQSVPQDATADNIVIAYEPVWAIGTGRVPTEDQIVEMHRLMRKTLRRRFGFSGEGMLLLYGGSVKSENAPTILALDEVNGALVGGASLKASDFAGIVGSASS